MGENLILSEWNNRNNINYGIRNTTWNNSIQLNKKDQQPCYIVLK